MAKLYFIRVCSSSVLFLVYSHNKLYLLFCAFIAPLTKSVSKDMLLKIK